MLLYVIIAVVASFLITYTITPLVRVLAFKIGAVDVPKDDRRMHDHPIPRIGGLGIYISFVVATACFCEVNNALLSVWIGGFLLVVVGILDDIFRLNAWVKLIGQIFATLVPLLFGITINHIFIGETAVAFGMWKYLITSLWIIGLTNAINLLDGLDGLACGVSVICSMSLLFVLIVMGEYSTAIIIAILASACLGFLPYNKNPAKIFMGDTGALFLGFAMSIISIQGTAKLHTVISFVLPLVIFALPIFDTVSSVFRRIKNHQSPFAADRHHIHHVLVDMGFNQKETVTILYAISALLGIVAISFTDGVDGMPSKWLRALIILFVALAIFILTFIVLKNPKLRANTGLMDDKKIDENDKEIIENTEKEKDTNDEQ